MEHAEIPQDMRDALNQFDHVARQIVDSFCLGLDSQDPPQIIYHYTNDVGLKGILETGQLWLTDIFNLNDPSELSHGFSHVVNILNERVANGPPESKEFAKHIAKFHQAGMQLSAHYFVCSFSSSGEDLGQWRAYADDGCGYALGFDAKMLDKIFIRDEGASTWGNCTFSVTYADAALKDIHRQLIEEMFDLISLPQGRNLGSSSINAYLQELSALLTVYALRAALFFKHEAYENESEYRFLQIHQGGPQPPPEVNRRYRSYELVKYRKFDWRQLGTEALKQIIVGPSADRPKATQFARDCLTAFHLGEVEILCSEIPYRAVK